MTDEATTMITPAMRSVCDPSTFDALMDDPAQKARALHALSRFIGWPLESPPDGSALVGLGPDHVVKVMAPHDLAHHEVECTALATLHGVLPVPTPELLDTGAWEGWPYIVMRRLRGVPLDTVWVDLPRDQQLSLAIQLGELLSALHGLDAPDALPCVDWDAWCHDRLAVLEEVQRAKQAPEALLHGLHDFLTATDLAAGDVAWLHTEVMPSHLLVSDTPAGWRFTGLFDFEPSWVGPVDYEYASVGLFFSAGDAEVLDAVQRAAGRSIPPRRLFAMACLHRYANLGWYHRRLGGPVDDLSALAQAWFGR